MENETEIKKFIDYINNKTPWNLWTPDTWSKPLKEREINQDVVNVINKTWKTKK